MISSVSGIATSPIQALGELADIVRAQATYATQVQEVFFQAVSYLDDDYLKFCFALMNESLNAQTDALQSYIDFTQQYLDLRMAAIERSMAPERGNYIFRAYA
jgi:chaperone required for assembly of F1-ATPase